MNSPAPRLPFQKATTAIDVTRTSSSSSAVRTGYETRMGFLLFVMLTVLVGPVFAQQSPLQVFESKSYPSYLTHLPTQLSGTPDQLKQKFPQIVAVAIALEKTKAWDGNTGKQARELVKPSKDATRYMDAMKMLLQGDTKGLAKFFSEGPAGGGDPPNYSQWQAVIPVLREHGFELAANCFETVYLTGAVGIAGWQDPKVIEQGVIAWVSIPKDKRGPVDDFMNSRFEKDWNRAQQVSQTALRLFHMQSRPETVGAKAQGDTHQSPLITNPREFYELALRVGKDLGIVSLDNARQLKLSGKKEEAVLMAKAIADQKPEDVRVQTDVARSLWSEIGDREAAIEVYQKAVKSVPEPRARDVRIQYAAYVVGSQRTDLVTAMQQDDNPLCRAEALLAEKKHAEAASLFKTQIRNPQSFGRLGRVAGKRSGGRADRRTGAV